MVDVLVDQRQITATATTTSSEKRALGGTANTLDNIESGGVLWAQNPPSNNGVRGGPKSRVGPAKYYSVNNMDSSVMDDHEFSSHHAGQINPARAGGGGGGGVGGTVETFNVDSSSSQQQHQHRDNKDKKKDSSTVVVAGDGSGGGGNPSSGDEAKGDSTTAKFLLLAQIGIIFGFLLFVSYDEDADTNSAKSKAMDKQQARGDDPNALPSFYPMFQDVHVMIFVGFGFLMTFLRKYGYSAVGYNFMIAAIAIQWSILCRGVFHAKENNILINIETLINGDFAAGAVLISFGAILGVSSPLQLLIMCLVEVPLYAANEYIGAELLKAIDVGGSMYIHTFGAYFGLAVSFIMRRRSDCISDNEAASSTSDVFAMIGTVFLWMFWPSFNAAMATGDEQHRAVLNTVLSLTGSCLFSFAMSSLLSPDNKFNMVHVQNASLAGGVAVGAAADLMIKPFGALIIGSGAGILSTAGYVYLTPLLQKTIGLHDTCGVHNLHGMPGVLAGLIGSLMAATASETDYGKSLYLQYPARAPLDGSNELTMLKQDLVKAEAGLNRSATEQAIYQLAALGVTLLIALVGGAVTGMILRISFFNKVPQESLFDDSHHWQVEEEESSGSHPNQCCQHTPSKYKDSQL